MGPNWTRVEIVVDGADVARNCSGDGGASPCGHVSVGTVLEIGIVREAWYVEDAYILSLLFQMR